MDINKKEHQKIVIQNVIIPGLKLDFPGDKIKRIQKILLLCLKHIPETSSVISIISFPFEDEIEDIKGFLIRIYEELYGEDEEIQKMK